MTSSLQSIIAGVLISLENAQDTANRRSADLSVDYRDTGNILHYFPVPNAVLDEVDVTLSFSVVSLEPNSPSPGKRVGGGEPPRMVVTGVAREIATLALADLRRRLHSEHQTGASAGAVELQRRLLRPAVQRDLTQNLTLVLHPLLAQSRFSASTPNQDSDARAALEEALAATFGGDEDLAASIGPANEWAQQIAQGEIGGRAAAAMTAATAVDEASAEADPPVSIFIDLTPQDGALVQTLRLRARLRNYRWVVGEDGEVERLVAAS